MHTQESPEVRYLHEVDKAFGQPEQDIVREDLLRRMCCLHGVLRKWRRGRERATGLFVAFCEFKYTQALDDHCEMRWAGTARGFPVVAPAALQLPYLSTAVTASGSPKVHHEEVLASQ
jgi:hypothetical protein